MKIFKKIIKIIISLCILFISLLWVILPLFPVGGMAPAGFTEIDYIKRAHPLHIINPEKFAEKESIDLFISWSVAETKARLIIISTLWVIVLTVFLIFRKRKLLKKF